jgi:hypothetical protein
MRKDRDEGLIGSAQNTVRETTGALRGYHGIFIQQHNM